MTYRNPSRKLLTGIVLSALANVALAWPDKPVTIIVPWPPGGPSDIVARPMAKGLQDALGKPFVIDNRAGAGGNLGTAAVAKSTDQHTLLITASGPIVINKHLYKSMPFNAEKDLLPVTNLMLVPQVIAVHPSVPANNLQELIAYIRKQGGSFQWGSAGNGTTQHLTGAMLGQLAKLDMVHVPYKGSAPAITDLVGGHIPMLIDSAIAIVPQIKAGKVKAIAVTGKRRSPQLPNVPTTAEAGMANFESYAWYGLFAPANLPKEALATLSQAALKFMRSEDYQRVMKETGSDFVGTTPAAFAAFVGEEAARWTRVAGQMTLTLD